MNRRRFVTLTGVSLVTATTALRPVAAKAATAAKSGLTIADALQTLDLLEQAQIKLSGRWNLYQVYTHLAQSVEYSMTGYPEQKSWLFQNTVGSLAFAVFSGKGSMNHGLDEAIPGAPPLPAEGDPRLALDRLRQALLAFDAYEEPLQPHFAYGELSKAEYEQAHVMHLNNHLDQFDLV